MGVSSGSVRRIARRADARVFCISGPDAADRVRDLRLAEGILLTSSPRSAGILLIAGGLHPGLVAPALVAHDAVGPSRATVWWRLGSTSDLVHTNLRPAVVVDDDDPAGALRRVHERLIDGHVGEGPLLADVEPAPWRGIGPYGQGGKGMTGGVPYGRPLAERADARDGLKLDRIATRVGPFFPALPAGLMLDVGLQGDVIEQVTLESLVGGSTRSATPFGRAPEETVFVSDFELARARSHLRWLSDAVAVAGGASLSERILRFARRVRPRDDESVRSLERSLRRRGYVGWNTRGVGVIPPDDVADVGGPVARASGVPHDARADDDTYTGLGFEPVVTDAGDCAARWIQRLREAAQALDLAARAGDARVGQAAILESPRGPLGVRASPSAALAALVPSLVTGMEWGDAVTTIVSLDLDPAEMPVGGGDW